MFLMRLFARIDNASMSRQVDVIHLHIQCNFCQYRMIEKVGMYIVRAFYCPPRTT